MHKYQCKESSITKKKVSIIPLKKTNKVPITDPKEIENYLKRNTKQSS